MPPPATYPPEIVLSLTGIILMILVIYSPTWIMLRHVQNQERSKFLFTYPDKYMAILKFRVAWLGIMLSATLAALASCFFIVAWLIPLMFYWVIGGVLAIYYGIFEIRTGISPIFAPQFRWNWPEYYAFHPDVLRAGRLRIMFGLALLAACAWLMLGFPN